ncbi:MAG: glycosyltransferase family 2 protein, partial [Pseudomonadota bacterium]
MPFFSVLIVNYNGAGWIGRALESLKAQTFQDFEVILVDNASSDGSLAEARSASRSDWTLIASDENLGFAKGNNVAATHAKGRWLALLNPDAQAHPDWLEHVADGIRRHPGSTMFACTQFATEDPTLLDGAGDAFLGFGIPWRGGFRRSASELPSEGQCFSPCGASAIYKKSVFDDAEGFDTRFFCYCEDIDLGFRL